MKVPKEESKEQNNDTTLNDDDNLSNPYDTESNSDSIDPPTRDGDFSEYMWMENQEEFDLQVHILISKRICSLPIDLYLVWLISHDLTGISLVTWLMKQLLCFQTFNGLTDYFFKVTYSSKKNVSIIFIKLFIFTRYNNC